MSSPLINVTKTEVELLMVSFRDFIGMNKEVHLVDNHTSDSKVYMVQVNMLAPIF